MHPDFAPGSCAGGFLFFKDKSSHRGGTELSQIAIAQIFNFFEKLEILTPPYVSAIQP
jgi:hypothetical protein